MGSGLTKRAPDVWESAAFTSIFLASSFSYISSIFHVRPHAGNADRSAAKVWLQMKTEWKIGIGIAIGLLLPFAICTMCFFAFYRTDKKAKLPACLPLPTSFSESDLVGTWTGYYFGHTDKLIIRADGTYKQIYSGDYINFESDWQKWYIEYDQHGYLRLHLAGMRRCDGLESECNDPGGGLPSSSTVVNPCPSGEVILNDEVILFVTGTTSDVPLGIILRQARLAGSDWTYTFRLEK